MTTKKVNAGIEYPQDYLDCVAKIKRYPSMRVFLHPKLPHKGAFLVGPKRWKIEVGGRVYSYMDYLVAKRQLTTPVKPTECMEG